MTEHTRQESDFLLYQGPGDDPPHRVEVTIQRGALGFPLVRKVAPGPAPSESKN